VYGPSGSGKSFLALDMACAIAEGNDWFGYRVKATAVVYVVLEGEAGFRLRVAAWERSNGRALPPDLQVVMQPFSLGQPRDVSDLGMAVVQAGEAAVVVIDTLNAATAGMDENSSADMGTAIEGAKALQRTTGGLVLLVAHTGKEQSKGLRGHSSLISALDAAIEVVREGDSRRWSVFKAKDGQDGGGHAFRLAVTDLPPDEDGEPVTSCVVRSDTAAAEVRQVKLPQGGNQKIVLDALRPLFKAGSMGKPGAPPTRPCIELAAAVSAGASHLTCATDRRAERAREAVTGLIARNVLGCNEGWLWLA
jgi:hypothetical protein